MVGRKMVEGTDYNFLFYNLFLCCLYLSIIWHKSSDTKRTLADVTRNDKADNEETLVNPIAALHHQHHPGVHFRQQHSQNPLENIELEKGLKLPPVTQMATYNGKPCIVHKWPSSAQLWDNQMN